MVEYVRYAGAKARVAEGRSAGARKREPIDLETADMVVVVCCGIVNVVRDVDVGAPGRAMRCQAEDPGRKKLAAVRT